MRILLFGKNGQVGWELCRSLAPLGEVLALDMPEINLAQPDTYVPVVRGSQAEVLINAAAYTAVDRAESEPLLAQAVNQQAPGILADECRRLGIGLVHFSTDYVYDGCKNSPYVESDPPNPLNLYGWSKLGGDEAVLQTGGAYWIFRTSWVYSLRGDSFVNKVLRWSRQEKVLRIVADQVGSPTWARMLAEVVAQLLAVANAQAAELTAKAVGWLAERRGIYHLAGDGYASRYEWAQAIVELDPHPEEHGGGLGLQLLPARTVDFPTPARRPLFTALNCDLFANTFGLHLPDWRVALQLAMGNHLGKQ